MDFEPCFKVHNLVSVHPKSIILDQMTNLNMIFHVVMSVYRLVKNLKLALTRPSSLMNFGTAYGDRIEYSRIRIKKPETITDISKFKHFVPLNFEFG